MHGRSRTASEQPTDGTCTRRCCCIPGWRGRSVEENHVHTLAATIEAVLLQELIQLAVQLQAKALQHVLAAVLAVVHGDVVQLLIVGPGSAYVQLQGGSGTGGSRAKPATAPGTLRVRTPWHGMAFGYDG